MRASLSSLVLAFAAGLSQFAAAAPIPLFNTGVNAAGAVLPDSTVGDPHYRLVATPVGSTSDIRIITSASGYPIPPYIGDNTSSRWIGPNNDGDLNGPIGNYTYRTTFDLTGLNAATASITGGWSTDNGGVDILINGVSLGYTTGTTQFSTGFAAFSVGGNFLAGINTLDFIVRNDGGPTALRVEMTGTADAAGTVPEPATLALVGAALLAGGLARRKAA